MPTSEDWGPCITYKIDDGLFEVQNAQDLALIESFDNIEQAIEFAMARNAEFRADLELAVRWLFGLIKTGQLKRGSADAESFLDSVERLAFGLRVDN